MIVIQVTAFKVHCSSLLLGLYFFDSMSLDGHFNVCFNFFVTIDWVEYYQGSVVKVLGL